MASNSEMGPDVAKSSEKTAKVAGRREESEATTIAPTDRKEDDVTTGCGVTDIDNRANARTRDNASSQEGAEPGRNIGESVVGSGGELGESVVGSGGKMDGGGHGDGTASTSGNGAAKAEPRQVSDSDSVPSGTDSNGEKICSPVESSGGKMDGGCLGEAPPEGAEGSSTDLPTKTETSGTENCSGIASTSGNGAAKAEPSQVSDSDSIPSGTDSNGEKICSPVEKVESSGGKMDGTCPGEAPPDGAGDKKADFPTETETSGTENCSGTASTSGNSAAKAEPRQVSDSDNIPSGTDSNGEKICSPVETVESSGGKMDGGCLGEAPPEGAGGKKGSSTDLPPETETSGSPGSSVDAGKHMTSSSPDSGNKKRVPDIPADLEKPVPKSPVKVDVPVKKEPLSVPLKGDASELEEEHKTESKGAFTSTAKGTYANVTKSKTAEEPTSKPQNLKEFKCPETGLSPLDEKCVEKAMPAGNVKPISKEGSSQGSSQAVSQQDKASLSKFGEDLKEGNTVSEDLKEGNETTQSDTEASKPEKEKKEVAEESNLTAGPSTKQDGSSDDNHKLQNIRAGEPQKPEEFKCPKTDLSSKVPLHEKCEEKEMPAGNDEPIPKAGTNQSQQDKASLSKVGEDIKEENTVSEEEGNEATRSNMAIDTEDSKPEKEKKKVADESNPTEKIHSSESEAMSNSVNNSVGGIQDSFFSTPSSDKAERDKFRKNTTQISTQLGSNDDISYIAEENYSEFEPTPEEQPFTDVDKGTTIGANQEVKNGDGETEPHLRERIVQESPTADGAQSLDLNVGLPLDDKSHSSEPKSIPEVHSQSDEPKYTPTPYVPPKKQLTKCDIAIMVIGAIPLMVVVVLFVMTTPSSVSNKESDLPEPVQVNNFTLDEQAIASQSQLWKEGDGLKILVVGRLGTGKSTLIRGLFEKDGHIVPLSLDRSRHKPTFDPKSLIVNDVDLLLMVWNHPKLEDVKSNKAGNLQKFDLILYIIKMSETRFPPKDSNIMKTLLEVLGPDFVSKTVFVLTHANQVGSLDDQNIHQKTMSILETKTRSWKQMIIDKLNEHSGVELQPVHFVHAGHPSEPKLYDIHWPSKVLETMFDQLGESKRPALSRACEKYWLSALQGSYEAGGCAS